MAEQENKKKMEPSGDEWLTQALRARSQTEARPGLEERILARIASERRQPAIASWKWLTGAALAFGLLLIVLVGREFLRVKPEPRGNQTGMAQKSGRSQIRNSSPKLSATQTAKLMPRNVAPQIPGMRLRSHAPQAVTKATVAPKLENFPAAMAATEQERLMAKIQRRQSTAALAQYAQDFHSVRDLEIEEIAIAPLFPETADGKPNR